VHDPTYLGYAILGALPKRRLLDYGVADTLVSPIIASVPNYKVGTSGRRVAPPVVRGERNRSLPLDGAASPYGGVQTQIARHNVAGIDGREPTS
jgi:hypothetical protein